MNEKIKQVWDKATDYKGSTGRKVSKSILGVVIVILLGALGLEVGNTDFDLGALFSGQSLSDSKVERTENGNIMRNGSGSIVTRYMRNKEGVVVPNGTAGGKYTDEYNCDDFAVKGEAQKFFTNAGGLTQDTNRLDGDKDGEACESLPMGR